MVLGNWWKVFVISVFSLGWVPGAGCGFNSWPDDPHVREIGPGGGQLELDNGFRLFVPIGALSEDVEITVEELDRGPGFSAGPEFRLGPDGLTFDRPVTVRLPLDPIDLPDGAERRLVAYTTPDSVDDYQSLRIIQIRDDYLVAETTHFSRVVAGEPRPIGIAEGENYPQGLACDGANVYWATGGNGANPPSHSNQGYLMSNRVGGGDPVQITMTQEDPIDVAVDAKFVYWVTGGRSADDPRGGIPSTIMRMPVSGGPVTELYSGGFPGVIAQDEDNVYWSDLDSGRILAVSKRGDGARVLATRQGNDVEHMVASGGYLYWTTGSSTTGAYGRVMRVHRDGSGLTTLASQQSDPAGLAVVGGTVYWANQGNGWIRAVPITGGTPTNLYRADSPSGLAASSTKIYFSDLYAGRIYELPILGGPTTLLVSGQPYPWRVELENNTLMWSAAGLGNYQGSVRLLPVD